MPIYEYECKTCDQQIELLLRTSTEKPVCPECGESELEKMLSRPASPSVQGGSSMRNLPVSSGDSCGAPRCCGGGCDF